MGNSPARAIVDVGSVIADTYTIEAVIGRGGMGSVFLASHRRLPGKRVAIKLLHAELADDEVVARFRREALIASQLNHPNIVDVTDFNVTPDGTPYLVLEYLQGQTLAQRLHAGPLPLDAALSIVRQVGSAIAAAHGAGIVHRDLKPQNIFLIPQDVAGRVVEIAKVLDFGISKIRGSQTVKTQESTLLGTPQYMAPEQALGQHANTDERTDLFALGAIVYEMLAGQPAFTGETIPEVVFKVVYEAPPPLAQRVPGLPPQIASAVARAMAKPAAERFSSVSAFIEALTGTPLAPLRTASLVPPDVGFAAGSRRESEAAFAQTMASAGGTAPLAPAGSGAAAHVDTDAQTLGVAGTAVAAAPVAPTLPVPIATPARVRPPRRTALIASLAIAGLVIAAAAGYFLTRSKPAGKPAPIAEPAPPKSRPPASRAPAVEPPVEDEPPAPPPAPAAPASDATIDPPKPPAPANVEPPKPPAAPRPAVTPPRPDEEREEAVTDEIKESLANAEAALRDGMNERAERFANTVLNSDVRGRPRARAHLVHGTARCAQRDREAAVIDYRKLQGFRALQSKLVAACDQSGVELK